MKSLGVLSHELAHAIDKADPNGIEQSVGRQAGSQAIEYRTDFEATRLARIASLPTDSLYQALQDILGNTDRSLMTRAKSVTSSHPEKDTRLAAQRLAVTSDRMKACIRSDRQGKRADYGSSAGFPTNQNRRLFLLIFSSHIGKLSSCAAVVVFCWVMAASPGAHADSPQATDGACVARSLHATLFNEPRGDVTSGAPLRTLNLSQDSIEKSLIFRPLPFTTSYGPDKNLLERLVPEWTGKPYRPTAKSYSNDALVYISSHLDSFLRGTKVRPEQRRIALNYAIAASELKRIPFRFSRADFAAILRETIAAPGDRPSSFSVRA